MLSERKRNIVFQLLVCISVLMALSIHQLGAVPALRTPISITQPDGSNITIRLYGDEFFSYRTTLDGYLLKEDSIGFLNYAKLDLNGKFQLLNVKANDIDKRTLAETKFTATLSRVSEINSLDISATAFREKSASVTDTTVLQKFPLNGSPKSLVILVNFSDKSFAIPQSQTAFSNLLNEKGYSANGGTGSARDYFNDNSMGIFNPEFEVVGPYNLKNNMAYYGGNISGNDKNPRQMIIDACTLADSAGVDFSQYDTNHDGLVDNVFIYYAGYNEAEGGSANTVWPHRWSLANNKTKFDGVSVYSYACTSELKGSSSTTMCGVGTFCHEFGHVLGLPDFYATNSATHHTLYSWDVMDYGPYNNSGRTPPFYSSYERFYLGWLTPTVLNSPQSVIIDSLSTSNKAYLISTSGNHNLNAANPSPVEFFMLENRQQKSWDSFLPGHGLLLTRVNYNESTWQANSVNNISTSMGVDIIEADEIATNSSCGSDPFPGASNVKFHNLTSREGMDIKKPLTEIIENNGLISFKFKGGPYTTTTGPLALPSTNITQTSFTLNWNVILYTSNYFVDVYQLVDDQKVFVAGFQNKNVGELTSLPIDNLMPGTTYYFVIRATDGTNITVNSNAVSTTTLTYTFDMFSQVALNATDISSSSFTANWLPLNGATNYIIDVFKKELGSGVTFFNYDFKAAMPIGWLSNVTDTYTSAGYYGVASPALRFSSNAKFLQTKLYDTKIKSLKFWYRGSGTMPDNEFQISGSYNGTDWFDVKVIKPLLNTAQTVTLNSDELADCKALRFEYLKPEYGNLSLDDIEIGFQGVSNISIPGYSNILLGDVTSTNIFDLEPNVQYYYTVVASNGTFLSKKSNEIAVSTSILTEIENVDSNKLNISVHAHTIDIQSNTFEKSSLQMINTTGQIVFSCMFSNSISIARNKYPHGIYMIRYGHKIAKLIL